MKYLLSISIMLACFISFSQEKTEKDSTKNPIYVIQENGKTEIVDKEYMNSLKPADIASISVLKGQDAVDLYGKEAQYGIVLITLASESSNELIKSNLPENAIKTYFPEDDTLTESSVHYRLNVDGEFIALSQSEVQKLDPKWVQSVSVIKDKKELERLGLENKLGIISLVLISNDSTKAFVKELKEK